MLRVIGKSVYGSIAIGPVCIFNKTEELVKKVEIEDLEGEKERYKLAKKEAILQLKNIYQKTFKKLGKDNADIFEVHIMLLEDEDYNSSVYQIIENQRVNAEYAVWLASDYYSEMFSSMDDEYMQARSADILDISNRLISILSKKEEVEKVFSEKMIICADNLSPSETVSLEKDRVIAILTAKGSSNSHTAILARNMNIPMISGLGAAWFDSLVEGQTVIVDGYEGLVIQNPDEENLTLYKKKQDEDIIRKEKLFNLKGKDNVTLDGRKVSIHANIGGLDDLDSVMQNDAGGIGLFRSEFLYLQDSYYPSEEKQFEAYKRLLEAMEGRKVIIRTLDIGADKQADYFKLSKEENPALGFRAIRLCLKRPEIFRTQLRALYRASVYGNLGIMFPMITGVSELQSILNIIEGVKDELRNENMPFSDNIELGVMIETPAAAVISDLLAPLVDFFSVGSNDLIQYTLACDRQNSKIEEFIDPHHEAVLRLIKLSADNAHKNGAWIGICGELASDTELTEEFLRMGIDEFSVAPSFVLKIREKVRSLDLRDAASVHRIFTD